jgi:hypothetical protein
MAIVIDKYDIVWYGVAVLEGDLQKVPSSFRFPRLLAPPRGLSLSEGLHDKRLNCNTGLTQ